MRTSLLFGGRHLAILLLGALMLPAAATGQSWIEDFSTTVYKDPVNTTANWNTVAGRIELYAYHVTLAGTCDTPGSAINVAIEGDYAYVADASGGLQVLDITDPTSPSIVASYPVTASCYGYSIEVAGKAGKQMLQKRMVFLK
jgi:hypothetical protein